MNEKQLEKRSKDIAKSLGIKSIKLASPNDRGQPDRMFLYNGVTIFIEMKGLGKKPTALQLKYIKELQQLGFVAEVVDNIERVTELLTNLKKCTKVKK